MSSFRSDPAVVPPALNAPTPTGELLVAAANRLLRARGRRPRRAERVIPGLDVAALERRYHRDPANTVQTRRMIFRSRLGATWDEYRADRDRAIGLFLRHLEARGYRLIPRRSAIRVSPGVYPARHPDPETGGVLLDRREFAVEVDCSAPGATPLVIQLDPEDVAPIVHRR